MAERLYDEGEGDVPEVAVNIPDDEDFSIVLDHATPPEQSNHNDGASSSYDITAQATEECGNEHADAAAPNKLQQFVGKCKIQLAVHNPLPPLCRALQESHFPLEHELSIEELRARPQPREFWQRALRPNDSDDLLASDLEAARGGHDDALKMSLQQGRDELVVANLSLPIQLAFRQSVLRSLAFTKCGIALTVCACIAALPFSEWREQNEASGSWLPHVMLASCCSLYALLLGLLYGVRFDFPTNGAVLVFLLCVELCCWVLSCLLVNVHAIAAVCLLYTLVMLVMYPLATRRWKSQASIEDHELLHPVSAATLSVLLVLAAAVAVFCSSVAPQMRAAASPFTLAGVLTSVALAGLWTGLTLLCMAASLAPEEHARCLVFYHSDMVVACGVLPLRWLQRQCRRSLCRRASVRTLMARMQPKGRDAAASAVRADHTLQDGHGRCGDGECADRSGVGPVEDARRFKDHSGGDRAAVAVAASASASASASSPTVVGGGGASRRRSSFAEVV